MFFKFSAVVDLWSGFSLDGDEKGTVARFLPGILPGG